MNSQEIPEYQGRRPADDDEVCGHVAAVTPAGTTCRLRCWDCGMSFPIKGSLRSDVLYACSHCHSLNEADTSRATWQKEERAPTRPPGSYTPPVRLNTLFLRDASGELFEVTREQAQQLRVPQSRLEELGHSPYFLPSDDVVGHHKTPGASAADPSAWDYHRDWQHGCYLDEVTGGFCVGLHRHPYGDERAVGAVESDFS